MTDFPGREARLRPEFAHLYPAITAGHWGSAPVMADQMVTWLLRHPKGGFIATHRILPAEHFDFRGDAARPASLAEGPSRRGDQH
jgi:hypothetical protein